MTTDGVALTSDKSTITILPASQWEDLSFNELMEQKTKLFNAWEYLSNSDSPSKNDFLQYLHNIDEHIDKRFID
jgi:hypothetical protein